MKSQQNKYSQMYAKIDRKQLSEQALSTLDKLRKATGNFRTKNQEPLDLFEDFYQKLSDKKPTAIKGSAEYKAMIKAKQTEAGKELQRRRRERQREKAEGKGGERDAHRPAKPYGWRLKGKHNYKKPTREDITSGRAYYEGRVNRADVKRKKYPMLERGGKLEEKVFSVYPHSVGKAKYVIDVYDGSSTNKDGSPFIGIRTAQNKIKLNSTISSLKEDGYKEVDNVFKYLKIYEDGGYMAKGGMINHGFRSGDKIVEIYKGYGIVENNNSGVMEIIDPSNGSRFVVEENVDPKVYIDSFKPIELVSRIETGSDRMGSMDSHGVQYAKGGVFYTEKHKND